MEWLARPLAGLIANAAVALLAYRRGSLAASGAFAALVVGYVVYVCGGPIWFAVMLAFFVTSSALGHVRTAQKERVKREYSKGDTRDALQVLANGGVAAGCAAAFALSPEPALAAGFLGALATANGDTWATELGVLSREQPWSLRQLRRVPRGTSGAVSIAGTLATVAGALLIGAVASLRADDFGASAGSLVLISGVGGLVGAFTDSWLGATLQAAHHCPRCEVPTEGRRHHCGSETERTRGLSWFGNDAVNFVATCVGAACASGCLLLL